MEQDFYSLSALNLAGAESAVVAANDNNGTGFWTLSGNDVIRVLTPIDIGNRMSGNVTIEIQDRNLNPSTISESRIDLDSGISIRRRIKVELRPGSLFASGALAREWANFQVIDQHLIRCG